MASPEPLPSPVSFSDFPDDVQLTILSFLRPAEIATFACTSRRSASLCGQSRLWFAMCDRRWGSKTLVRSWAGGGGCAPFALLYRALDRWENLIGFWRRISRRGYGSPSMVFFEWGASSITGSFVSPSPEAGNYGVIKIPFLWMGLSPRGEPVSFLRPASGFGSPGYFEQSACSSGLSHPDLVPVTVGFMGENHFVVEENRSYHVDVRSGGGEDSASLAESLSAERLMPEVYQYFANWTNPVGDKSVGEQRWKGERGYRLGRRRWEAEHFVKIADCSPTPSRPLQGLWKEPFFYFFLLLFYHNSFAILLLFLFANLVFV